MKSTAKVYRDAAALVDRAWLQRDYYGEDGSVCLVASIFKAEGAHDKPTDLPEGRVRELHAHLWRYVSYRLLLRRFRFQYPDMPENWQILEAIMSWNDLRWRRKETVVRLLNEVALDLAFVEISDLRAQLNQSRQKIETLNARIEQLERENRHLWKRLRNYAELRDTRTRSAAEAQVCDELDRRVQALNDVITTSA